MKIHKTSNFYLIRKIEADALPVLDVDSIGIHVLAFRHMQMTRARYDSYARTIIMNPSARCFQPDYRGYKYKTFGGVADLTPGGVFLHECGHALTFKHPQIIKAFKALWQQGSRKSITGYGSSCVREDIAETFRLYMSNGNLLAQIHPARYDIIDDFAYQYVLRNF